MVKFADGRNICLIAGEFIASGNRAHEVGVVLKHFIKSSLASAPGWSMYLAVRSLGVCVLTYHRINPEGAIFPGLNVDTFREHMIWLRKRCRPVSADEFVECLGRRQKDRLPVLVTFDDGYRDYHDIAFPVLDDLGIPSLVFIPTAFIGRRSLIWTDRLVCAVEVTEKCEIVVPWAGENVFGLTDPSGKLAFVRAAKSYFTKLGDGDRRTQLDELLDHLGVPKPEERVERQMMTWDEVKATMPLTTYGGHSHEHSILSRMDPVSLERDIQTCRDTLTKNIGSSRFFAYPNGQSPDFNDAVKNALRSRGFDVAFTTNPGVNDVSTDRMELRRQATGARNTGDFAGLIVQSGR